MSYKMLKSTCLFLFIMGAMGCYSLKGVIISPDTKTFSISLFTNNAAAAPPTLAQTFTEKLKDKIRNNTRLSLVNTEGADLVFAGQVVGYDIVAVAPQPNQPAAFNQLRITINVELLDAKNEKGSWKQPFSFQADFPGSSQLLTVQDQLIKQI
jgi:hypothetical protein